MRIAAEPDPLPRDVKLCVDFTPAVADATGVGTSIRELVRALVPLLPPRSLLLAVHSFRHPRWREKLPDLLGAEIAKSVIPRSNPLPHRLLLESWRSLAAPGAESLFGPLDLFHGTSFLVPPCRRAATVVTCHDLAFIHLGDESPVAHDYHRYLAGSLTRADRIIVPSPAVRMQCTDYDPGLAPKVRVVPHGAPFHFPLATPDEVLSLLRRHRLPDRYVLALGTLEPRKNLVRLVRAFRRRRDGPDGAVGLLLVGRPGHRAHEVLAELEETRRTRPAAHVGFVPTPMRNALLANAAALIVPSLFEGFGLTVLEAFRAGTPVLAARAGALPETAGDAALTFDPRSEEDLLDSLDRLLSSPDLSRELVQRGRERLPRFTFDRTARETLAVYREALVGTEVPC